MKNKKHQQVRATYLDPHTRDPNATLLQEAAVEALNEVSQDALLLEMILADAVKTGHGYVADLILAESSLVMSQEQLCELTEKHIAEGRLESAEERIKNMDLVGFKDWIAGLMKRFSESTRQGQFLRRIEKQYVPS